MWVMMKLMMVMVMAKTLGMISMAMRKTLIVMIPAVLKDTLNGLKTSFLDQKHLYFWSKKT